MPIRTDPVSGSAGLNAIYEGRIIVSCMPLPGGWKIWQSGIGIASRNHGAADRL